MFKCESCNGLFENPIKKKTKGIFDGTLIDANSCPHCGSTDIDRTIKCDKTIFIGESYRYDGLRMCEECFEND